MKVQNLAGSLYSLHLIQAAEDGVFDELIHPPAQWPSINQGVLI